MIPMNPVYLLYYVPICLAVSIVLSATRHEQPKMIFRQSIGNVIWISGFMLIVAAVLQFFLWLI